MKNKFIFLFLLISILGFALRFYRVAQVPPGVNQDEASIGYTAFSLITTGNDEYGRHLPISFESFGDWKLPFYIYSVVPMVKLFGLDELAVRLPSVLFGTGSVILTFFFIQSLFKNTTLSFLTMFLLAISPWSIHLSRVESESNTAVFFVILGTIFFLKSQYQRNWLLVASAFCFGLTYFIYAGNHVSTTLIVLGIIIFYGKSIPRNKSSYVALLVFLLLSGFIFIQTLTSADKTKLSGIGIFGDPSVVHANIEIPRNEHSNPNSVLVRLLHNRVEYGIEHFFQNYLNSFSPQFLFISGGTNRAHNIENFGNMYLVEAPFLLLGFFYVLTLKKSKEKSFILWWLLIGPIAASITKDAPHTNRMFAIFPMLPLFTAFGILSVFEFVKKIRLNKKIVFLVISFLILFNLVLYLDRYYVHFPKDEVASWGNGYKELSSVLASEKFTSKPVVMNKPQTSPYIYLLFYSQYDSKTYQKEAERYSPTEDGFVYVKKFSRFEFRKIDWNSDLKSRKLIVADPTEVPEFVKNSFPISQIVLPNGKPMFSIVDVK